MELPVPLVIHTHVGGWGFELVLTGFGMTTRGSEVMFKEDKVEVCDLVYDHKVTVTFEC